MAIGDVTALINESGTEVFAVDQSGNMDVAGTQTVVGAVGYAALVTASAGVTVEGGTLTLEDGVIQHVKGNGTGTGDVVARYGLTATEGLELRVFEKTITPSAVETDVIALPASSQVLSVQANVETALTGGGTTVTWSLGTAADPDKYGTAGFPSAGDSLAQNGKSNYLGDGSVITSVEQMKLTGTDTGGANDGNTALTVGSVRVRVIYYALNSLDNA